MITDKKILNYIENYFDSIEGNLPHNSKFDCAYKYNIDNHNSTDNDPLTVKDRIVFYYTFGVSGKRNSFKISNLTIISYLRNKKIEEILGDSEKY
jgi:hypothetical protein